MSFDTEGDTFKGLITLKVKNKNIVDKLITTCIKGVDKVLRIFILDKNGKTLQNQNQ